MQKNEFIRLCNHLNRVGLKVPKGYYFNLVRHHNRGVTSKESLKHFVAKAICSKILYEENINHATEYKFDNGIEADVFNFDSRVVIEFESKLTPKNKANKLNNYKELIIKGLVNDIIIIGLDKLGIKIDVIERKIRHKLGL